MNRRHMCGLVGAGLLMPSAALAAGDGHVCSYREGFPLGDKPYRSPNGDEGSRYVEMICRVVGIAPRFELGLADHDNATAKIEDGKRSIVYDLDWLHSLDPASSWPLVIVMAHEIGHHIQGHTALSLGPDRHTRELEADFFSGFVVAKVGGTLESALSVVRQFSRQGSETHPPRDKRMEATEAGWREGRAVLIPGSKLRMRAESNAFSN